MLNEKLACYQSILLNKRKFILKTIESLRAQIAEGDLVEHEKHSDHLADLGSDAIEREHTFMLLARELKYLNQIDQALNRIDIGKYGICKICGEEIDSERLEAVPTTDICVPCKIKFLH